MALEKSLLLYLCDFLALDLQKGILKPGFCLKHKTHAYYI